MSFQTNFLKSTTALLLVGPLISFVKGRECDDESYCCGTGSSVNGTCTRCCITKLSETIGYVSGSVIAAVILVAVAIVAFCCFHPRGRCYNDLIAKPQRRKVVNHHEGGLQNHGFRDGAGRHLTPISEQDGEVPSSSLN